MGVIFMSDTDHVKARLAEISLCIVLAKQIRLSSGEGSFEKYRNLFITDTESYLETIPATLLAIGLPIHELRPEEACERVIRRINTKYGEEFVQDLMDEFGDQGLQNLAKGLLGQGDGFGEETSEAFFLESHEADDLSLWQYGQDLEVATAESVSLVIRKLSNTNR
jgi:hypothetical protein